MTKYPTESGYVTRAAVYSKLLDHLREAADMAATLSHLHNTEDGGMDKLIARGWLGIHELLLRLVAQITKLAANKFQ